MTQSAPMPGSDEPETISTGSVGLDEILGGGLDGDRVYLIEGRPGTGDKSETRRLRLAFRDASAFAKFAALPKADSCLEEFLCWPTVHRDVARRFGVERPRPSAAQHRARGYHARAAVARIRGRASPASRCQDARHEVSRRVSRLHDPDWRARHLPSP